MCHITFSVFDQAQVYREQNAAALVEGNERETESPTTVRIISTRVSAGDCHEHEDAKADCRPHSNRAGNELVTILGMLRNDYSLVSINLQQPPYAVSIPHGPAMPHSAPVLHTC